MRHLASHFRLNLKTLFTSSPVNNPTNVKKLTTVLLYVNFYVFFTCELKIEANMLKQITPFITVTEFSISNMKAKLRAFHNQLADVFVVAASLTFFRSYS